jgi:putative flippase GtrA
MRREFIIFLIVGSFTTLVDFITYRSLIWIDFTTIDIAKGLGFLTGTVFAYLANKLWTFGHKEHAAGSAYRFAFLYGTTLTTNVMANNLILTLLNKNIWAIQIAFFISTGISAVLNFIGMKLFAFKEQHAKQA